MKIFLGGGELGVGFEVGRSALWFCHNLLYVAWDDGMIDDVQMIWKKMVFS